MLAVIEDEEQVTVSQREDEALDQGAFAALRHTECPRDGREHEVGIAQRG